VTSGRDIQWQDESPDLPEARPLDWEAFRRSRSLPDDPPDGPVGVFMTHEAMAAARRHGRLSPDLEVGGILYGRVYRNAAFTAVDVVAALPAHDTDGTAVHLTFTSEAWDSVFARRAELEDDLEIVGWYHTHPGLGVFLSGTDLRTHAAFFPQAWHVALVIDPLRNDAGAFLAGGTPADVGLYKLREPVLPRSEIAAKAPRTGRAPELRTWLTGALGIGAIGVLLLALTARLERRA
jgi:proteasome lid subunit RPN8/RPN11